MGTPEKHRDDSTPEPASYDELCGMRGNLTQDEFFSALGRLKSRGELTEEQYIRACHHVVSQGYKGTLKGAAGGYEYECSSYYAAKARICEDLRRITGNPGAGI